MPKLMDRLGALRESLHDADASQTDSFTDVFNTFLGITETAELIDVSKPIKDKGMRSLIELVARRHLDDPALVITGVQMLHHAPSALFHGSFFAGALPCTFFYFVGEQQGIVALIQQRTTHLYRITAGELPPGLVIGRKRWNFN